MLKSYPAIFHKEEDGSYWVEFPEFGGGTQGARFRRCIAGCFFIASHPFGNFATI